MTPDEYSFCDAHDLAARIKRGSVTAHDVLDLAIEAMDAANPRINAVVVRTEELARRDLAQLDPNAPFAGVPFLVKDAQQTIAGYRMAEGNKTQSAWTPNADGELVRRLRSAGFLIIGKTNVPEYSLLPTTEPELHGPSRNPWDLARTTGGSSGGSAAAVASRVVPAAHGSDAGGSIRIPASCCGVFGLKPTRGRVTDAPFGTVWGGLSSQGVITRSVRDNAALLDLFCGAVAGDPYPLAPPARPFAIEAGTPPGTLRIGMIVRSPLQTPVSADCVDAARRAASLCQGLGHSVTEIELPHDPNMLDQFVSVYASTAAMARDYTARTVACEPNEVELELFTSALAAASKEVSGSQYMAAWEYFHQTARALAGLFEHFDVLLTPTLGQPPVPLGFLKATPENPLALAEKLAAFSPFCVLANITGLPAMSVPLHWNQAGLPIGVQFIGRFADESTLFRLAAQLESAQPWAGKMPSLPAAIGK